MRSFRYMRGSRYMYQPPAPVEEPLVARPADTPGSRNSGLVVLLPPPRVQFPRPAGALLAVVLLLGTVPPGAPFRAFPPLALVLLVH